MQAIRQEPGGAEDEARVAGQRQRFVFYFLDSFSFFVLLIDLVVQELRKLNLPGDLRLSDGRWQVVVEARRCVWLTL